MFNYQLPITSYQLPITSYQLPVTSYQSPISSYQLRLIMQNKPNLLYQQNEHKLLINKGL
jgi:hypothetical protein